MPRPAPFFNVPSLYKPRRSGVGSQFLTTAKHAQRSIWWKVQYWSRAPFAIRKHRTIPRILLDRDLHHSQFSRKANVPELDRWEKIINGMRVTEDRWAMVEEEGKMHRVNWKMYCQRLETELQAQVDNMPQYTVIIRAAPIKWKKLDGQLACMKGLSVREAMAQCKLSMRKGHQILFRALELAQQGAETKGLDKEKLRVAVTTCWKGPVDHQIDIRSRGYYAWKSKKASTLLLTVSEDPEMVLPDRSAIPYASMLTMKRAGLREEPTVLDVPAITAEGI